MKKWTVRMRMPGAFDVGWRRMPQQFDTKEEAQAAAAKMTSGALRGWETKIGTEQVQVRKTTKMVLF